MTLLLVGAVPVPPSSWSGRVNVDRLAGYPREIQSGAIGFREDLRQEAVGFVGWDCIGHMDVHPVHFDLDVRPHITALVLNDYTAIHAAASGREISPERWNEAHQAHGKDHDSDHSIRNDTSRIEPNANAKARPDGCCKKQRVLLGVNRGQVIDLRIHSS